MRLLSRYLVRQLAAPFVFAFVALISLLLLSQIAKRFGALVGKGLPWTATVEVFALTVPFIVAQVLPIAVLLAVLYTFSHLAADNEITAMRASGIGVHQILAPLLVVGTVMAGINYAFFEYALPRSNTRLLHLWNDILRKKATFELREEVINEIPTSPYFLRASRIDPNSGRLRDVTIYDIGSAPARRVIYADSGLMAYADGRQDLSLRLYDGAIHQYRPDEPALFQLTYFRANEIRVKDVFDQFERSTTETALFNRRATTTRELLARAREAGANAAELDRQRAALLDRDLTTLLRDRPTTLTYATEAAALRERAAAERDRGAGYWVEIHKKLSISAACIAFVIIGLVAALRVPRGGMGLVIGGGMVAFSVYNASLTVGEKLADRGRLSPWLAMWSPTLLFTALGLIGLVWVNRDPASDRGDGMGHLVEAMWRRGTSFRRSFARLVRSDV